MNADRFDRLSQAVGRATSRRRALAALAGGAAAVFAAPYLTGRSATAWAGEAERAAGTALINCVGHNFPILDSCEDIVDYALKCGVVCPGDVAGTPGMDGCTLDAGLGHTIESRGFLFVVVDDAGACITQNVTARFQFAGLQSAVLRPSLSNSFCCQAECEEENRRFIRESEEHEAQHRERRHMVAAIGNSEWVERPVTGCGPTEEAAFDALQQALATELLSTKEGMVVRLRATPEPPNARPRDCSKCQPSRPDHQCVNGTCQRCCGPQAGGCCGPAEKCCGGEGPHCCGRSHTCCFDLDIGHPRGGCCPPATPVCCAPALGGGCCPATHPRCCPAVPGRPPSCCPQGCVCAGNGNCDCPRGLFRSSAVDAGVPQNSARVTGQHATAAPGKAN